MKPSHSIALYLSALLIAASRKAAPQPDSARSRAIEQRIAHLYGREQVRTAR
jgi:hypothetical protein